MSIRLLLVIACSKGWKIRTRDVDQAYLKSTFPYPRDVFVKPTQDMHDFLDEHPGEDFLLKMALPVYGNADAGDYWHATMSQYHRTALKITPSAFDPSLYKADGDAQGMVATTVDDSIITGNAQFLSKEEMKSGIFKNKGKIEGKFTFSGLNIDQKNMHITVSQPDHIQKLTEISPSAIDPFRELKSRVGQLLFINRSEPKSSYHTSKLAQITRALMNKRVTNLCNEIIRNLKAKNPRGIRFAALDLDSLGIDILTDSSLANNLDLSTQLGIIAVLRDKFRVANIVHWRSWKSRRIARSSLGAEAVAFSDGVDLGFILCHELEWLLGHGVPLDIYTDSQRLFNLITTLTVPTEKRVAIDIAGARNAYQNNEVRNIGLIASEDNPADAATKDATNKVLNNLLENNKLEFKVRNWVFHNEGDKNF